MTDLKMSSIWYKMRYERDFYPEITEAQEEFGLNKKRLLEAFQYLNIILLLAESKDSERIKLHMSDLIQASASLMNKVFAAAVQGYIPMDKESCWKSLLVDYASLIHYVSNFKECSDYAAHAYCVIKILYKQFPELEKQLP